MKYFKYFIIFVLRLLIILTAAGYIIGKYYGDEVKNKIISELNKNLTIEIDVRDIVFSVSGFIEDFPNVSINFIDITAKSNPSFNRKQFSVNTDTLFVAKKLSLQFSVMDIWDENYRITSIYAEDGKLQIFRDIKGYGNYDFWEEADENTESNIVLKINDLKLKNIDFQYIDKHNTQKIVAHADKLRLTGNFSSESYDLSAKANLFVRSLYINNINYVDHHSLLAEVDMKVDNDLFSFRKSKIELAGLQFNLSGDINNIETTELNIDIEGKDVDIQSFLSMVPKEYSKYTEDYESSGDFYFEANISGKIGNNHSPHFETRFGINNGTIHKKSSSLELESVSVAGTFTNGFENSTQTTKLDLKDFKALLGNSSISGTYSMENFNYPNITLNAITDFDLSELHNFIQLDTIELLEGKIKGDISFKGKVKNIEEFTVQDFKNAQTKGKVKFQDVNVTIENSAHDYKDVSGGFTFRNNDIYIDSLHFSVLKNIFDINGYLKNFLSFIFIDDQSLSIEGNIVSDKLLLENLLNPKGTMEEGESAEIDLPDKINLDLNINLSDFEYKNFFADKITGKLKYHNNRLIINDMIISTMGGFLESDLEVKQLPSDKLIIRSNSKLKHIDISKLFHSFDNFGQSFIIDKHLKGSLTSDIYFSSVWSSTLVPDPSEFYIESDLVINDGELVDFEPMMELSRFIEVDELKHIKFSKLKNTIVIQNQKIDIPQMEIASSAFNLEASGIHSFDNEFAYKIEVLLSEVLSKKARKAKKENNEFGIVEDDGLGRTSLYLTIVGNIDDFKIAYDRKKAKAVLKETYREEKEEIKSILNEEFGLFKKDSAVIKNNQKKLEEQEEDKKKPFKLNWDDDF